MVLSQTCSQQWPPSAQDKESRLLPSQPSLVSMYICIQLLCGVSTPHLRSLKAVTHTSTHKLCSHHIPAPQFTTDEWVQQRSCDLSGLKESLNAVTAATKHFAMQHHHLMEVCTFPHTCIPVCVCVCVCL